MAPALGRSRDLGGSGEHPAELASALAARLRDSKVDLVRRWLDRISARVSIAPNQVFPTAELLNHVPMLVVGIADYLEHHGHEIDADMPISRKAMELGALRHSQGFGVYEILKEYEILGKVLFAFVCENMDTIEVEASRQEWLTCWQRITHAVEVIRQATISHFLHLAGERVSERENQLRRFNRMVSHELKNKVGAIRGAAEILSEPGLEEAKRPRFRKMIIDAASSLQTVLEDLSMMTRLESDARQSRNVLLPAAAAEAVRQLRERFEANDVRVEIAPDLPNVEVDAAPVEMCLMNYLSNAIKYSDKEQSDRWVRIEGELQYGGVGRGGELIVRVRDNGIGVPPESRAKLFDEFYRAHPDVSGAEGSGLGLSLVRETIEWCGGRAWAEFPDEGGSVFAFSLPSRRKEDAAAAGTPRPDALASTKEP